MGQDIYPGEGENDCLDRIHTTRKAVGLVESFPKTIRPKDARVFFTGVIHTARAFSGNLSVLL